MGKINKQWHQRNIMPKNPTKAQRAKWHLGHIENCACRKPTPGVQKLLDEVRAK